MVGKSLEGDYQKAGQTGETCLEGGDKDRTTLESGNEGGTPLENEQEEPLWMKSR